MLFNVLNGGSVGAGGNPAANMQTQRMHDELLDIANLPDYYSVMALPPGPQKEIAIAALHDQAELNEAMVPEYWKDDAVPRQPLTLQSSWVQPIQYDPVTKVMTVFGKSYANVDPQTVSDIVNGDIFVHKPGSIGSAMNKFWDDRFGVDRPRGRAAKGI